MPSLQSYSLLFFLQYLKRKNKNKVYNLSQRRKLLDRLGQRSPLAEGVITQRDFISQIPVEWLYPPQIQKDYVIIYLHGGAYQMGSIRSHRSMVSRLVNACQAKALLIDYRLAPENPFPAALEDVTKVYQTLLEQYEASALVLVGDSAGGGLALSSILHWKENHLPRPAALVLLSPWVDLQAQSETLDRLENKDPILSKMHILEYAQAYYQNHSPQNPLISPLYGDLQGLPPSLIQVGTHEILLGEAQSLAQKAQALNPHIELEIWKNMFHVWHFAGDRLPEAQKAFKKIASFLDRYVATSTLNPYKNKF